MSGPMILPHAGSNMAQIRPDFGRQHPQSRPMSTQIWSTPSKLDKCRPILAQIGPILDASKFGRYRPDTGRNRPISAGISPHLADVGPRLADFGSTPVEFGPNLAEVLPELVDIGSTLAGFGPSSAISSPLCQRWPASAQNWPHLRDIDPKFSAPPIGGPYPATRVRHFAGSTWRSLRLLRRVVVASLAQVVARAPFLCCVGVAPGLVGGWPAQSKPPRRFASLRDVQPWSIWTRCPSCAGPSHARQIHGPWVAARERMGNLPATQESCPLPIHW